MCSKQNLEAGNILLFTRNRKTKNSKKMVMLLQPHQMVMLLQKNSKKMVMLLQPHQMFESVESATVLDKLVYLSRTKFYFFVCSANRQRPLKITVVKIAVLWTFAGLHIQSLYLGPVYLYD